MSYTISIYVGIDPGEDGAIAFIRPDGSPRIVPIAQVIPSLDIRDVRFAMVEKGHVMPKFSRKAAFTFGVACGRPKGWLEALNVPFEEIQSVAWQKVMLAGHPRKTRPQRKAASILVAQRLFPGVDLTLGRGTKPKDGASDALLIAEFARRTYLRQPKGSDA